MAKRSLRIPVPSTKDLLIGSGVVGVVAIAYFMGKSATTTPPAATVNVTTPAPITTLPISRPPMTVS